MVLDDVFARRKSAPPPRALDEQLAHPVDRIASVVADIVLFFPVLALVIAPFARHAKESQLIGNTEAWSTAVFSAVAMGVLLLIVYQTVFVSVLGGTPGQLALRLRVVSVWGGGRPKPFESFLRALVWSAELAALGLPWLAVFSNARRRPFHDRVADTIVISLVRRRQVGMARLAEMSIASGFQSAALAVFTLVVTVNLTEYRHQRESVSEAIASREDDGQLCAEIREAIEDAPGRKATSVHDRLQTALSLHAVEAIGSECLDHEAEFALWRGQELSLAYLAKGIASDDDDRAAAYFDKACGETETAQARKGNLAARDVCYMAQLAEADDDSTRSDGIDASEQKFNDAKHEAEIEDIMTAIGADSAPFLRISALRRLMDRHDYAGALRIIDFGPDSRRTGAFMARKRAEAFWNLGRAHDAEVVMRSSVDLLDANSRLSMSRWFCYSDLLRNGCEAAHRAACGILTTAVDRFNEWLLKPDVAVTYVRAESCANDRIERLKALVSRMPLSEGKSYTEAALALDLGRASEARAKLRTLAESADHGAFFIDANLRLIEVAGSVQEFSDIYTRWVTMETSDEAWKPLGHGLLRKLAVLKAWDTAIAVGLRLAKSDPNDRATYETMVIAATRAGKRKLALGMLEQVSRLNTKPKREPASQTDFIETARGLLQPTSSGGEEER